MKYGVHWTARIGETAQIREAAHVAEELGYQSFGLPDHLFTSRPLIDPFVGLTVAAEATSDIKLSTMVVLAGLRRSVPLAREVASLQSVSNNRLELGIGAGWVEKEKDALARWTEQTPLQRVTNDLELMHCAFKGLDGKESKECSKECSDVDHALARTITHDVDRPTIMIAAGGPKMLQIAGKLSDIAMITMPTDRRLTGEKPSLELLREQVMQVTQGGLQETPPAVQFQIREYSPNSGEPSEDLWALRGSHSEIKDRLTELETLGVGYISLCTSDVKVMEDFAHGIF